MFPGIWDISNKQNSGSFRHVEYRSTPYGVGVCVEAFGVTLFRCNMSLFIRVPRGQDYATQPRAEIFYTPPCIRLVLMALTLRFIFQREPPPPKKQSCVCRLGIGSDCHSNPFVSRPYSTSFLFVWTEGWSISTPPPHLTLGR